MANKYKGNFKCVILSPRGLLFEGAIQSLFVKGDTSEYELLAYHYPLLGLISNSEVLVNEVKTIPIKQGILRFFANECNILVDEDLTQSEADQENTGD